MPVHTNVLDKQVGEQAAAKRLPPDTYITMSGIDWATFEGIANRSRGGRVCYSDGELEIMSPSFYHEDFGRRLGDLVIAFCDALDIGVIETGSTTWKNSVFEKGVEPDASFYLDDAKIESFRRLTKAEERDSSRFPSPDLAIEIDIRRPSKERSEVYAAIGVIEVWEFNGEKIRIRRLGPKGSYKTVNRSGWFPISALDIQGLLLSEAPADAAPARRRSMRAFVDRILKRIE